MAELREYKPTLRDKLRYGIQDTLMNFGVDPYEAGRWGGKIAGGYNPGALNMGLLDFTPAAIPVDMQEAKQAFDQGRYVDAAASGLGAAAGLLPLGGVIAKNAPEFARSAAGALKIPGKFEEMTPEQKLWTYMQGPWADYPNIGITEKGYLESAENFNKMTGFGADIESLTKYPYQYGVEDAPNNPFYVPDPLPPAEAEKVLFSGFGDEDLPDIGDLKLDDDLEITGEGILDNIVNEVSGPPKLPTATVDNYKDVLASMSPEQIIEWYYATPFEDIPGSYGPPNLDKTFLTEKEIYTSLNDYFKGKDMGGNPQKFAFNQPQFIQSPLKNAKSYDTFQDAVADGNYAKAIDMLSPEQTAELMYMKPYSAINMPYSVAEDKQFLLDQLQEKDNTVKYYFDKYLSGTNEDDLPFEKVGSTKAPAIPPDDELAARINAIVAKNNVPVEEQIMELLRTGRGSEVTDEMMREANQVRLTQMYDLPMDEASRMGRATGMGAILDETARPQELYHAYSTQAAPEGQFDAFKGDPYSPPGRWNATYAAENPEFANKWGERFGMDIDYATGQNVPNYAVKPVTIVGQGDDFDYLNPAHVERARAVAKQEGNEDRFDKIMKRVLNGDATWADVEDDYVFTPVLEKAGFRSAVVSENAMSNYIRKTLPERRATYERVDKTQYGMPPSMNRMVFRPQNIRSIYARFDPRLKHLKHLSAGIGGLAAANALEPDMANELAEEYLQLLVEQPENNT